MSAKLFQLQPTLCYILYRSSILLFDNTKGCDIFIKCMCLCSFMETLIYFQYFEEVYYVKEFLFLRGYYFEGLSIANLFAPHQRHQGRGIIISVGYCCIPYQLNIKGVARDVLVFIFQI